MSLRINFDTVNKTETLLNIDENHLETNILGQSLIDFIECDLNCFSNIKFNYFENNFTAIEDFINQIYLIIEEHKYVHSFFMTEFPNLNILFNELSDAYYSRNDYSQANNIALSIIDKLNYKKLQNDLKEAIHYCMDHNCPEDLKKLSNKQRMYIYDHFICKSKSIFSSDIEYYSNDTLYNPIYEISFHTINRDSSILFESGNMNLSSIVEIFKDNNIDVKEWLLCKTLESACITVFHKMILENIRVKKCKNCGKYFILSGKYNTEYCDRILPGEKRSCKQVGAKKTYNDKLKNDPVIQLYDRSYKTHFARIKYGKLTKEEFFIWCQEATQMRDKVKLGELTLEGFKQWLKNS